MRVLFQKKLLVAIAIVLVLIIVIEVNWVLILPQQPAEEFSTQEHARDDVMEYIRTNNSETAQFINDLAWKGVRVTREGFMGAETYTYTSIDWNVTITYPIVLNPV